MYDKPQEECGVFGIYNRNSHNVVQEVYTALFALQHRGQFSCGMALNLGDGKVVCEKGGGIVPEVFSQQRLEALAERGTAVSGIGHVHYSRRVLAEQSNAQPLVMRYAHGTVAIANNGCLTNAAELRARLEGNAIFQTGSDAELIGYLLARERLQTYSIEDALLNVMEQLSGAYSLVLLSPQKLLAARDPNGFRPLCIGKLKDSYVVASESCAITGIGGEFVRDVEPGEVIVVGKMGLQSIKKHCGGKSSLCIFEYVYFARPDSVIDGTGVHMARKRAGARLWEEYPVAADAVIGVPDSGNDAAIGFAQASGIPYETGFMKNRYVGRTFIQENQRKRELVVDIKLNPIAAAVKGRRVVLVDDSIVRGTTFLSARIADQLRAAGATEVHVRISSPPYLYPCYFGTDVDSRENLLAFRFSQEEICAQIGADSLGYLSLEGLRSIAAEATVGCCEACFTGEYPIPITGEPVADKYAVKLESLEKKSEENYAKKEIIS